MAKMTKADRKEFLKLLYEVKKSVDNATHSSESLPYNILQSLQDAEDSIITAKRFLIEKVL